MKIIYHLSNPIRVVIFRNYMTFRYGYKMMMSQVVKIQVSEDLNPGSLMYHASALTTLLQRPKIYTDLIIVSHTWIPWSVNYFNEFAGKSSSVEGGDGEISRSPGGTACLSHGTP